MVRGAVVNKSSWSAAVDLTVQLVGCWSIESCLETLGDWNRGVGRQRASLRLLSTSFPTGSLLSLSVCGARSPNGEVLARWNNQDNEEAIS
jgi:hypothetical protein